MIKSIPLNKLVQSPRNVRRHSDPAADAELKASIAAHGLLQNLIVRPAAKGKFEVEAGERRRRAMLALADDKILARDHEVTCLVLEDSAEAAVETSLAENFHRLAMNPADEAQAFAALVSGGATVEDVTHDWRTRPSTTLRAPVPAGPIIGFEAKDAPASSGLAEFRSSLDESWRAGGDAICRFDLFRALPDDSRAAWLGYVVARSLEASLNMAGERQLPFQDHLGSLIGIDMVQWWRPNAANYFDRVSKQVILDALTDVGGLELSSRFASVKKGDLAMSAERVFAGTYITEVEVREKALAWVPEVMRFAAVAQDPTAAELGGAGTDSREDDQDQSPRELAA